MKVQYSQKPEKIRYMQLPEGGADVWLRKNIKKHTGEREGTEYTYYEADEVYFRTNVTKSEIEADFEEYFAGNLPKPPAPAVPDAERISALESAILDLAEVIANG